MQLLPSFKGQKQINELALFLTSCQNRNKHQQMIVELNTQRSNYTHNIVQHFITLTKIKCSCDLNVEQPGITIRSFAK